MRPLSLLVLTLLTVVPLLRAQQTHQFGISGDTFQLDGKPFQVISGEMHYPRIPRARWQHDLRMARAMGLNAITVYTFWNAHEAVKGKYDFSGDNDVATFIRMAQKEGLYVILRPGPYVCAEWDWGGFPAWLGKGKVVPLRTTDPAYMNPVRTWLKRLAQELAPLQLANGGPILAIQVENEYGSYGKDSDYIRASREALLDAGFDKTFLYSTDGGRQMVNDRVPGLFSAVNFGAGKNVGDGETAPRKAITEAQRLQPGQPVLVGEFWDGWFDHWGSPWVTTDSKVQANVLESMLKKGFGVSIYMFVGGTSFGWMNGANSPSAADYQPDITSYDYDSALSENGAPTPKYFLFRDAIRRATGVVPPAVPATPNLVGTAQTTFTSAVSLWQSLPKAQHLEHPVAMEDLDQAYGYILYRTTLVGPVHDTLTFDDLHQYADIYANGKLLGSLDRRLNQKSLALNVPGSADGKPVQLDILVENTGRINFGPRLQGERTGILGDVHLGSRILTGWDIVSLPMDATQSLPFRKAACEGACFVRATWRIDAPADTYLDTRQLGKGMVWVNGRALGRFWNIGPQGSLYVPASWLHAGANDVVVFDLYAKPGATIRGIPELIKTQAATKQASGNQTIPPAASGN